MNDECIEWQGKLHENGYGLEYDPRVQKHVRAHRLSEKGNFPLSNKIELNVSREDARERYRFDFNQRTVNDDGKLQNIKWYMYLDDGVLMDPRRFNKWMQSMVADIQTKQR